MNIEIKTFGSTKIPQIISKGDWIDLCARETIEFKAPRLTNKSVDFDHTLIPLGIAMKLPEGFEAILAPRSSTFIKKSILQTNSIGIIDSTYCGNIDEWKFPAVALDKTVINAGDKICQFRIQLSQKATVWQKLKWLFSSSINLIKVDSLEEDNRGGFGTTGGY
jgi:dUTP pyrophosphatase